MDEPELAAAVKQRDRARLRCHKLAADRKAILKQLVAAESENRLLRATVADLQKAKGDLMGTLQDVVLKIGEKVDRLIGGSTGGT